MQFSLTIILALASIAVQALPSSASPECTGTTAQNANNIEVRGLLGDLLADLPGRNSSTSTSSVSSSTSTSTSTSTATSSATADAPTSGDVQTYGNDVIETIRNAGTTGDRVGFRWAPVGV